MNGYYHNIENIPMCGWLCIVYEVYIFLYT